MSEQKTNRPQPSGAAKEQRGGSGGPFQGKPAAGKTEGSARRGASAGSRQERSGPREKPADGKARKRDERGAAEAKDARATSSRGERQQPQGERRAQEQRATGNREERQQPQGERRAQEARTADSRGERQQPQGERRAQEARTNAAAPRYARSESTRLSGKDEARAQGKGAAEGSARTGGTGDGAARYARSEGKKPNEHDKSRLQGERVARNSGRTGEPDAGTPRRYRGEDKVPANDRGHSPGTRLKEGDARTDGAIAAAAPASAAARPAGSAGQAPAGNGVTTASAEQVKAGDRFVVTIKRIGINGEGVGYFKRKAVFIPGALPDEVVKATVVQVEPTYIGARLDEVEKASPARQQPPCPVYDSCGGCQLQHLSYAGQLAAKEELLREAFRRYTGIDKLPLRPFLGMDEPWGYRNKAQLQVGREEDAILTGLYAPGSHRLTDISGCIVQDPAINRVMAQLKEILAKLSIPLYDEERQQGVLRTIVARVARTSGQIQLTFVTAEDRIPDSARLLRAIRDQLPMVTTIAQNVNKAQSSLIFGEKTKILWGAERLEESLGDVKFSLSPRAFFQLNPSQTVKLYDAVKEAAALTGDELVVDAYCGTGTIGLWLSPYAREVRGIELLPEAVDDARDSAAASGVDNARFYVGRAEELLPDWVRRGVRPDVVVVDPPRTGCERALLDALGKARPTRLVYVSCNPATLAKDCKVLLERGYRLEWVQPVDMFPHTSHVECCVSLVRKY